MIDNQKDFSRLVDLAMANNPGLSAMRPVVERELLHHEIFHALDAEGLLKGLVFQGGTSLRLCRGSARFSEDLDFAGGAQFSARAMEQLQACLQARIGKVFHLDVAVRSKPSAGREGAAPGVRVDKWWITIETAPGNPAMPRQKIKLEVANVPAHTRQLVPIRDHYGFFSGTNVLVNTETLAEVMADKVLAFPTSLLDNQRQPVLPGARKIRHRDLWDLAWLEAQGTQLDPELVLAKVDDYGVEGYPQLLGQAVELIPPIVKSREFKAQMSRFIDSATWAKTLAEDAYLDYLHTTVQGLFARMQQALRALETPDRSPAKPGPKSSLLQPKPSDHSPP